MISFFNLFLRTFEHINHIKLRLIWFVLDCLLKELSSIYRSFSVHFSALYVVLKFKFNGLVFWGDRVGVVSVTWSFVSGVFRDMLFWYSKFYLSLRLSDLLNFRLVKFDSHSVEWFDHIFSGTRRVSFSRLVGFDHFHFVSIKHTIKSIRHILHHLLKSHNLLAHIWGNHGEQFCFFYTL